MIEHRQASNSMNETPQATPANLTHDPADEARIGERIRLDEHRLDSLLKLSQMIDATAHEIMDFVLDKAVALTKSEVGYLAFLNEDETVLTMYSWSRSAMAECQIIDKPISYPLEKTGLWGEAVRQRKPVITNDYAAPNPHKKGYPAGHIHIRRHMNVPVFDAERVVAVVGVGNKQGEYDESDVRQLRLLMEGMWRHLQRRQSDEELAKYRDNLEQLVAVRTAELSDANEELEEAIAQLEQEVASRIVAEEALSRRLDAECLLNTISSRFAAIEGGDLAAAIDDSLAMLGEFLNSERVTLFVPQADSSIGPPRVSMAGRGHRLDRGATPGRALYSAFLLDPAVGARRVRVHSAARRPAARRPS